MFYPSECNQTDAQTAFLIPEPKFNLRGGNFCMMWKRKPPDYNLSGDCLCCEDIPGFLQWYQPQSSWYHWPCRSCCLELSVDGRPDWSISRNITHDWLLLESERPVQICSTHTHTLQFCGLVSSLLLPLCLSLRPSNRHRLFFPVRAFLSDWSRTWSQYARLTVSSRLMLVLIRLKFWSRSFEISPTGRSPPSPTTHTMVYGEPTCLYLWAAPSFPFSFPCCQARRGWLTYSGWQGGNVDLCGVCAADKMKYLRN